MPFKIFLLIVTYLLSSNAHAMVISVACVRALELAGVNTVQEWVGPFVHDLIRKGVPLETIAEWGGVPADYLAEAADGTRKNLGREGTDQLQIFFNRFPREAGPLLPTIIEALQSVPGFDYAGSAPNKKVGRFYAWAPNVAPIEPGLAQATANAGDAMKYFATDVRPDTYSSRSGHPKKILLGKIGTREVMAEDSPNERFLSVKLKGESPTHRSDTKVYLNIPFSQLKTRVPHLLDAAEAAGAFNLKFNGVSKYNFTDKVVVFFANEKAALTFASSMAKELHNQGISGGGVPFAFQVGQPKTSPVSVGRDPGNGQSWRNQVSQEIANAVEAIPEGPNRVELVQRYLMFKGIDPRYWLPSDFVQNHQTELDKLANEPF